MRSMRRFAFFACALCLALLSAGPAMAQVSGTVLLTGDGGGYIKATFTCLGAPTCSGVFDGVAQDEDCSNTFALTNEGFTLTGVDLAKAAFSGTLTLADDYSSNVGAGGVCSYTLKPGQSLNATYNATLNGSSGTLSFTGIIGGQPGTLNGTFTARIPTASPVFPMTVNGSITPTSANANAAIQPRTQDVGSTGSIFVFAHAPASLVHGAAPPKRDSGGSIAGTKDDAIVCVLAQVNSSGQLVAVSASTMQAYLSGVLSSQSQAVQVLNNVPTPNVAGAAVYVGYGTSASNMLASGVYQTAISVPGGVQCTASLASAPAPTLPGALTGLWWNASESGWGIHFTQRGTNVFAAWYTYDAAGNPKWYVASNCFGASGTSGTCTGKLYEVNGPRFFGANFDPTLVHVVEAGTLSVTFQDANNGSMTYTAASQTRTVAITRQPLGSGTPAVVDYSDLWWNASESGWGMAMAQQAGNVFLAWYVYDSAGKPIWYVASNCTLNGSSCSGPLYRTTGPAFGPTFDSTAIKVFSVGSVIVSFIDANNAVLSYTVDGVTATKAITRQLF
jgi:hypothetical protein